MTTRMTATGFNRVKKLTETQLSTKEIAEIADVSTATVHRVRGAKDFEQYRIASSNGFPRDWTSSQTAPEQTNCSVCILKHENEILKKKLNTILAVLKANPEGNHDVK